MQISSKIPAPVVQAVISMMSPYCPELSPTGLVAALKDYKVAEPKEKKHQKPYTRQEVAELLGLSTQTINRMMNRGTLKRIHVGLRAVRIDCESVRAILEGGISRQEVEDANH